MSSFLPIGELPPARYHYRNPFSAGRRIDRVVEAEHERVHDVRTPASKHAPHTRLEPDIPEVLHLLALISMQTDRADGAVKHLEKAVAKVPAEHHAGVCTVDESGESSNTLAEGVQVGDVDVTAD